MRLLRVTSYTLRFTCKTSTAFQRRFKMYHSLSKIAELLWVKAEQQNYFIDIFEAIRHRKKHELISKLNFFIDIEGCLRSIDRFKYAPLPYEETNPVLLPNNTDSHFSCLIIHHFHEMHFHAGTNQTINIEEEILDSKRKSSCLTSSLYLSKMSAFHSSTL